MKAGIHPDYVDTTITCACGEVIHTRSTEPDHPGGGLLQVPSLLHREAEAPGHGRARRALPAEVQAASRTEARRPARRRSARRAATRLHLLRSSRRGGAVRPGRSLSALPCLTSSGRSKSATRELNRPPGRARQVIGSRPSTPAPPRPRRTGRDRRQRFERVQERPRPHRRRPATSWPRAATASCASWPQAEIDELRGARRRAGGASCGRCSSPATPTTTRTSSSRSGPAPAATRPALFAADLARMYTKYAERQRWKVEVIDSQRHRRRAASRKSSCSSRAGAPGAG